MKTPSWKKDYWHPDDVILVSKVEEVPNIGNAIRIVKTGNTYEVQFAPILRDGTIEEFNWGAHDLGPGSHSSDFDTLKDAKRFVKYVKSWKPKDEMDDGLDTFQKWINQIKRG